MPERFTEMGAFKAVGIAWMEPFRYPIPKCYPCDDVTKSASVGKKSVVTHKWPLTWQGRFTKMQSVFCRVLMLNHSMAY